MPCNVTPMVAVMPEPNCMGVAFSVVSHLFLCGFLKGWVGSWWNVRMTPWPPTQKTKKKWRRLREQWNRRWPRNASCTMSG